LASSSLKSWKPQGFAVKVLAAVLALVTVLVVAAGCGGGTSSHVDGVTDGSSTVYLGQKLKGMPFSNPLESYEAASCLGSGTDQYFGYDGLYITAYPDGGSGHYIGKIEITGSTYKTSKGAYAGMSLEDFKAIYGEPDNMPVGRIVYSLGSGETLTASLADEVTIGTITLAKSTD